MRTKLLRADDGSTLLIVYPATKEEYDQALATLARPGGPAGRGNADAGQDADGSRYGGAWVVTTAAQRDRWGLADLAAAGRVRVVDEHEALALLRRGAVEPAAADEPPAEATPPRDDGSGSPVLEAVRALAAPGARVDPDHALDREYLECLLSVPWNQAHRDGAARLGARPGHPRRAPCGARRGQGAADRLRGGAPVEPGRPVAVALPAGPAESGFIMHISLFH